MTTARSVSYAKVHVEHSVTPVKRSYVVVKEQVLIAGFNLPSALQKQKCFSFYQLRLPEVIFSLYTFIGNG